MMRINRNSKGFTLIELLIVVAIIGILAAIAIPAYSSYTTKAKAAGIVHAMGAIKNAILAYYTESGGLPAGGDATAQAIADRYGIDVAKKYAEYAVDANGIITATIGKGAGATDDLSTDTNGTDLVLTPNWGTKVWTWSGTIPTKYLPKS